VLFFTSNQHSQRNDITLRRIAHDNGVKQISNLDSHHRSARTSCSDTKVPIPSFSMVIWNGALNPFPVA
jgi:hypothetical protein